MCSRLNAAVVVGAVVRETEATLKELVTFLTVGFGTHYLSDSAAQVTEVPVS